MTSDPFAFGSLYAHDFIMKELKIGNSGGIRVSINKRGEVDRVVLFSTSDQEANPQENPYQDRVDGNILTYTGSGKIGNQNLSGQNLRLTRQNDDFFPIYVFSLHSHRKSVGSPDKRWRFSGIYKYLNHFRENQTDLLGSNRNAWIFKLLRLEIGGAHPCFEAEIRNSIKQAFADPLLNANILLEKKGQFMAKDIEVTIKKMNQLDPIAFEFFVKSALIASHFRDVRVSKKSADGGVDIIARMPLMVWPVESQLIQVQVKRWQRAVGRREVAELRGSLIPHAIGVIVTTGNYAKTAIIEAERPHLLPISLVDGHKLAEFALNLNLEIN